MQPTIFIKQFASCANPLPKTSQPHCLVSINVCHNTHRLLWEVKAKEKAKKGVSYLYVMTDGKSIALTFQDVNSWNSMFNSSLLWGYRGNQWVLLTSIWDLTTSLISNYSCVLLTRSLKILINRMANIDITPETFNHPTRRVDAETEMQIRI